MFLNWFDFSDVADVIIVSMLIYAGLLWFKRTRAFLVVAGIVILGVVYAFARYFDLFLTSAILQGFFAVLLIAIIIIFQEEIRHFFERIAVWGLGRQRDIETSSFGSLFVRAIAQLAKTKTGALIVVTGRDPIWRHVEGGVELQGKISEIIIKNVFNKGSPGHDGALIIENGRIAKFAAMLPLSKNLAKLAGRGTRHAAALGLSERCDALCIVVSEERGTVSLARNGELYLLTDMASLGNTIGEYFREKFPRGRGKKWKNFFKQNLREKLIAIVLAISLWAIFGARAGIVQRDFVIPVEFTNTPAEFSIDRAFPRELAVTVSGDERAFKLFNPDDLKATIDLGKSHEGRQWVPVTKKSITKLPRNLNLDNLRPEAVDVMLKKNDSK